MVSSLAEQLAQGASVNAQFIASRTGRTRTQTDSYLFSEKEVADQDLDSILALAQNGVAQLSTLAPELSNLSKTIFAESSRSTDRTVLEPAAVVKLDKDISRALNLVSPYLLQPAAAKIIEWLVRRFR